MSASTRPLRVTGASTLTGSSFSFIQQIIFVLTNIFKHVSINKTTKSYRSFYFNWLLFLLRFLLILVSLPLLKLGHALPNLNTLKLFPCDWSRSMAISLLLLFQTAPETISEIPSEVLDWCLLGLSSLLLMIKV